MHDYTVRRIDEMERAFGGLFIRARASLGASAFGMNILDLPPNSGDAYPEHDHSHDGQEEIYFLLSGEAEMVLPDAVVEMTAGETFIRVGPATRRRLRSGPKGARVLALGAVPGAAYMPQGNSELGGPEEFHNPTASTSLMPDGPAPQIARRGRY